MAPTRGKRSALAIGGGRRHYLDPRVELENRTGQLLTISSTASVDWPSFAGGEIAAECEQSLRSASSETSAETGAWTRTVGED